MSNTALITGASGGIGLELARIHAQKGGNLILVARSEAKLNALAEELSAQHGISVTVIVEDLAQPESAQRIFDQTEKLGLQVDTLINNAGFGGHGLFHERSLLAEQQMMQVNMISLTNLTHHYSQGMVARRQGKILNISSTASFMPGPLQAVYYASKAFVTSFTQAIAQEMAEFNVTATALCPGPVATGFVSAGNLEGVDIFKNAKTARSVAQCGYTAMEQGELVAFNEAGLKFALNWIIPLLPRKILLKISRKAMEKTS
ncbi:MAG: SDR family oxidoreductase [Reinekea forsetii]|jgi:short-subunit dehydrogenase|uniref:Short chain dehydrogenase/reductase family protein n=1 Tax=Reinekea forsetii TaxID=1336806 RepID=A0A2K8KT31_9GAMM|nr:SDR family oxidoreductase [Reinekea forsetii]ATX76454.1 short chain dehydrogenase/reductase family protein [Reinekea forsetii]MDO7641203.1 SDR family oxidoreductase [Reinekea forsetii]MDO7643358.1 SDR family oxidoreductase [Reinekea forsetii]MDO7673914.1 SDR family oxidoreductase [Reinekea forsetii]|tara:strand:- start:1247 stop:2026 length:780 start_codon:yes stop_codon:yes gene_type:complete